MCTGQPIEPDDRTQGTPQQVRPWGEGWGSREGVGANRVTLTPTLATVRMRTGCVATTFETECAKSAGRGSARQ